MQYLKSLTILIFTWFIDCLSTDKVRSMQTFSFPLVAKKAYLACNGRDFLQTKWTHRQGKDHQQSLGQWKRWRSFSFVQVLIWCPFCLMNQQKYKEHNLNIKRVQGCLLRHHHVYQTFQCPHLDRHFSLWLKYSELLWLRLFC